MPGCPITSESSVTGGGNHSEFESTRGIRDIAHLRVFGIWFAYLLHTNWSNSESRNNCLSSTRCTNVHHNDISPVKAETVAPIVFQCLHFIQTYGTVILRCLRSIRQQETVGASRSLHFRRSSLQEDHRVSGRLQCWKLGARTLHRIEEGWLPIGRFWLLRMSSF